VLFLFVVMMLDVDFAELRAGYTRYAPIGALIGFVVLGELLALLGAWQVGGASRAMPLSPMPDMKQVTNTEAIGRVLYSDYVFYFEAVGIILLTAMIGAIVLTYRRKEGVKRQDIAAQVARTPKTAIEIRKVEVGKGI
jgi:NADH-quinone oxidoreductase subunit J